MCVCWNQGRIQGGAIGVIVPLKLEKVTLITMVLYNSENNIRNVRPFCCPLFCPSSFVKYTYLSYSSEAVMRLDYQILQKLFLPHSRQTCLALG